MFPIESLVLVSFKEPSYNVSEGENVSISLIASGAKLSTPFDVIVNTTDGNAASGYFLHV